MKKVAFFTALPSRDLVAAAVAEAARANKAKVTRLDSMEMLDSVLATLWRMIKTADVVVADVSHGNANVIYEIGLAHGAGKPVILLSSTGAKPLPADLSGQLYIQYSDTVEGIRNLEYRLTHLLREHFDAERKIPRLRGPSDASQMRPGRKKAAQSEFDSILEVSGAERHHRFTDWFATLLDAVPSWEVVSRAESGRDRGYDLVVWNSSSASEFGALGNPIPIELKAHKTLRSDTIAAACQRAQLERLKGIIFATTAKSTASTRKLIQQLYDVQRFAVLLLDYDSLHTVTSPEDLLKVSRSQLQRVVYGVADDV